jgi:hypothetical protein
VNGAGLAAIAMANRDEETSSADFGSVGETGGDATQT